MNDLSAALQPLLKASQIKPKDYIVLNNIAEVYYRMKDKSKAIEYYNLVIKYGDKQAISQAEERIKELN